METITIVKEEIKQTKKGDDYVAAKLSDGRYVNLFAANMDAYDGLGDYEIEMEKDGKFWNAQPGSLKGVSGPRKASEPAKAVKEALRSVVAPFDYDRGKLINTCVMSAAQVYQGTGVGIDEQEAIKREKLVKAMAENLLVWAEKKLTKQDMDQPPF